MAALKRSMLAYRPPSAARPVWPADARWRFALYLFLSIMAWLLPPWGSVITLIAILVLGRWHDWGRLFLALGWFWLIILAPVISELSACLRSGIWQLVLLGDATWRSLSIVVLLAASQWFTANTTVFEIKSVLGWLFRPLGRRAAAWCSFLAALTIGFVPWVMDEMQAVNEAACLRAGRRRSVRLRLAFLGLPVFARVFAKARHTAEAVELRGGLT